MERVLYCKHNIYINRYVGTDALREHEESEN